MQKQLRFLKSIFGYISLKYKLFILLVAISIIPIVVVSYSSQYFMFRSSTSYAASVSSQYVRFVSQDLSSYLKDLSQSVDALIANSEFQYFLDVPKEDTTAQANAAISFRPILQNTLQIHKELLGVLYVDRREKVYFESLQLNRSFEYNLVHDPFYSQMIQTTSPELKTPHPVNYTLGPAEEVFSFVRPAINLTSGTIRSWIIIEIPVSQIKSMLSGTTYGQEGTLLLVHASTGTVVSNVDLEPSVLLDLKQSLQETSPAASNLLFSSGGVRYEATYEQIPYGEWKLVWMAPLNNISKGVQQSFQLTLLIAAMSLAASLIIAFPVMNIVLQPLYKLKGGMQRVGRGAYVPIQAPYSNDEFGYLLRSYNQMLTELQRMEQEVFHSQMKEKERELLQLQAQINPHFLFNTLETIESYAVKNNGDAVGDMVQSVSRMMRYNVRNDGGWAPIREEIAYIRNFLTIHHYRHGTDVETRFDLEPDVMNRSIMKLSIQPFVENAIKYGWSPAMRPEEFTLTVKVDREASEVRITIQDTGIGIPPEVMGKLQGLIASRGEPADAYFQKHTGIFNVYRRFLLAYGEGVQLQISSFPDQGTRVEIAIPD